MISVARCRRRADAPPHLAPVPVNSPFRQQKMKNNVIIAAVVIGVLVILAIAFFSIMELRASNELLRKIALLQPGTSLASVTNQLGSIMREEKDLDRIISFGIIKDRTYCQDKKLFWFYASTPPCRALQVYTDTNNVIVYVTWHGL